MKMIFAATLAAAAAVAAVSPADARQGCGPGFHRGPHGHCRPNDGPGVVATVGPETLVIGNFYRDRGYWDGRRYYKHRYRWHNGWRYR
jgi:hypothetical protein